MRHSVRWMPRGKCPRGLRSSPFVSFALAETMRRSS